MNADVSIWVGKFGSSEELMDFTNIEYSEDGDSISSDFEIEFNLEYYNRDLIEKDWISQSTHSLKDLLDGFSYSDQFIDKFDYISNNVNAAILIYDFRYDDKKTKWKYNSNELKFIGVAQYTLTPNDR